jgi:hypothetical protein
MRAFLTTILSGVLLFSSLTNAQAKLVSAGPGTAGASPAKTKLTPSQKRALRMLQAAEAESAGLEPEMRAFVLWQVAQGYQKLHPARYGKLLEKAFQAASAIEPNRPCDANAFYCDARDRLQQEIGGQIIAMSTVRGESLLARASPEARAGLTAQLIGQYTNNKDFDRALKLAQRSYDEGYFPLGEAGGLLIALPPDRSADRLEVFNLALGYIQQNRQSQGSLNYFGTMVARFWKHLPPSAVLEAIEELLDRAKEADEKGQPFRMAAATERGTLEVTSFYEYRLFQMLPVLKQLDPSRAESVLRENPGLQAKLEKYPAGLLSILPDGMPLEGEKTVSAFWVRTSRSGNMADAARQQAGALLAYQQGQAVGLAAKDPKGAINAALSLPLWGVQGPKGDSPRASALVDLTAYQAVADAGLVPKALTEALKIAEEMEPQYAGRIAAQAAERAASYKDAETAQLAIDKGMKIAEKLYARDTDASDPNQAMKIHWPSVGLWRRLAEVGARIAPDAAEDLANSGPDPEIRALQRVACANAWLGVGTGYTEVVSVHKDGNHEAWSY